jgi:predicted transcriptional regulator
MIHSISLSQEVYSLLQQRAQQARTSPDTLAEDALRRQLGLAEPRWQQASDRLLAKVQAHSASFDPDEIEADITAAADEVKELRRARRRAD